MKKNPVKKVVKIILFLLVQMPIVLWQHMFIVMYYHNSKDVDYSNPITSGSLIFMIILTLLMTYKFNKLLELKFVTFGFIPIALAVAIVFDSSYIAQICLFILYLVVLFLPAKEKVKIEVWCDNNFDYLQGESQGGHLLESFENQNDAIAFMTNKLDAQIRGICKTSLSEEEVVRMYKHAGHNYFLVNNPDKTSSFSSTVYVEDNVKRILNEEKSKGILMEQNEVSKKANTINNFSDLLKRGNLPDDNRVVPNWLKIKNRQFDNVDITNNSVDSLCQLTSDEFNEFVSLVNNEMLFVYLSTMSNTEMDKFYTYNDEVVQLDDNVESDSSRVQFEKGMEKLKTWTITEESKKRATLETPLMITYAKDIYRRTIAFKMYIASSFYNYKVDDEFKMYDGHIVKVLWEEMKYIPNHLEQIFDHFKDNFYDETNEEHKSFSKHLVNKYGYIIYSIYKLNFVSQVTESSPQETSLAWFVETFLQNEALDVSDLKKEEPLHYHLGCLYDSLSEQNDEEYITSLISVVESLFKLYPLNSEACEYAMVEMMKSVAVKKVSKENANRFISFFGELPRFYKVLNYNRIYDLKEKITHTLSNSKPQDNEVFDQEGVQNKLILLNYFVDMEDLYYESGQEKCFEVYLDGSEDCMGKSIYIEGKDEDSLQKPMGFFATEKEANKFIETKVDEVIKDMAKHAKSIDELKNMDPMMAVSYYIKTKDGEKIFFKTWAYIQKRAEYFYTL